MFKGLHRLKAAARDKPKKEDLISKHKSLPKDKQRKLSKTHKKKNVQGATSIGDLSQSSGEASRTGSQTGLDDASDANRGKGKRQISKACEEAVTEAVSQFFECAWMACAERFFITSAPVTVSYELRNTWLRVMEAEWQDPDMREKPSTSSAKHNRIFKKDQPPLPLAFDTWSRGAIEPLPYRRRESVMDPFLRDLDALGAIPLETAPSVSLPSSQMDTHADLSPAEETTEANTGTLEGQPITTAVKEGGAHEEKADAEDTGPGEKWNFELDQNTSLQFPPESESESVEVSYMASENKFPPESPISSGGGGKLPVIAIMLSPRLMTLNESTTETESGSQISSDKDKSRPRPRSKSANPAVMRKFSPSQCGGRAGSGVFRLPHETTSEALQKRNKDRNDDWSGVRIEAQNAVNQEDITLVTKIGETSSKFEVNEEPDEVQPLFEERTPRVAESSHGFKPFVWRRPSLYATAERFKGSGGAISLEQVASEINKRFLKRRIVNLHGRFKRQALRALAARARAAEALRHRSSSQASTEYNSEASLVSSNKMKNRNRFPSTLSTSTANVNTMKGSAIIPGKPVVAKAAASEPMLGSNLKKEYRQRHLQQQRKSQSTAAGAAGSKSYSREKPASFNRNAAKTTGYASSTKGAQGWNNSRNNDRPKGAGAMSSRSDFNPPVARGGKNASGGGGGGGGAATPSKNNLNKFNTMGNVRPTKSSGYRGLTGGKFEDTKLNPAQLQSRFDTGEKFSRGGNRGWAEQGQIVPTPSDCQTTGTCSLNPSP